MSQLANTSTTPPEPNIGDAFSWPMRDPEWISKLLLMGLIGLIPIVGALQQLGWMLTGLDNLRAGRYEVPPARFRYARRGVWLFVASLIYGVITMVIFYAVLALMIVAIMAVTPRQPGASGESSSGSPPLLVFPLMFATMGLFGLVFLALFLFVPVAIEFIDRRALGGAFNIPGFLRAILASPREAIAAGALALVSYLISGLGTYLCWIGVIFTFPYSLAVLAGVLRWYEVRAKAGSLPV